MYASIFKIKKKGYAKTFEKIVEVLNRPASLPKSSTKYKPL